MFKTRFISMLVLLMTAVTGAWADEQSESFTTATYGQTTYTGEHFTITGQYADQDGLSITGNNLDQGNAANTVTISSKNGENITRIEAVIGFINGDWGAVASTSGNVTGTYADGQTITISSVNATTVTLSSTTNDTKFLQFKSWTIYYASAPAASTYTVTLKEGTEDANKWEITPAEATTTGVAAGTEVKATYGGTKKVKSVKAVKKAAAAGPTAYTLAESTQGMIVGTDGKAYDVADKDNLPTGVTAAGMVAYKSGSNGLVIALADEASTMNWSTANGASGAAAHTPTVTGQTWKLPSQAEWQQMFSANGGNQATYTGLNTALAAAGGDSSKLQEPANYWSSSEIDPGVFAYRVYLFNGDAYWYSDLEVIEYEVRACLAF